MIDKKEHGGIRPGAGRKPIADAAMQVVMHIRMSQAQRDKVEALGGGQWVRAVIDEAHLPIEVTKK